jgi:hypothetical protein
MWPGIFTTAAARATAAPATAGSPALRRRWMIVEGSIRREVSEIEYRSALASCDRIEVARYPNEDVVTHLCYRTRSAGPASAPGEVASVAVLRRRASVKPDPLLA